MIPGRKKKSTEELLKRESGFVRVLPPFESHMVAMIAILWAFFQLSLPCFLIIDSTKERAIHLAFAITLLFLVSPCFKKTIKFFSFLSARDRIPLIDYALAAAGALTALYIVLDYEGIAMRAGAPTTRDLVVGSMNHMGKLNGLVGFVIFLPAQGGTRLIEQFGLPAKSNNEYNSQDVAPLYLF